MHFSADTTITCLQSPSDEEAETLPSNRYEECNNQVVLVNNKGNHCSRVERLSSCSDA